MRCNHEEVYYLGSRTSDDPDTFEYHAIFWCLECGAISFDKADRHPDALTMPIDKKWREPEPDDHTLILREKYDVKKSNPELVRTAEDINKMLPHDTEVEEKILISELDALLSMGFPLHVAKKTLIGKYVGGGEPTISDNGKYIDLEDAHLGSPCKCGKPYMKQGKIWWCPGCKENFVVD